MRMEIVYISKNFKKAKTEEMRAIEKGVSRLVAKITQYEKSGTSFDRIFNDKIDDVLIFYELQNMIEKMLSKIYDSIFLLFRFYCLFSIITFNAVKLQDIKNVQIISFSFNVIEIIGFNYWLDY